MERHGRACHPPCLVLSRAVAALAALDVRSEGEGWFGVCHAFTMTDPVTPCQCLWGVFFGKCVAADRGSFQRSTARDDRKTPRLAATPSPERNHGLGQPPHDHVRRLMKPDS